MVSRTALTCNHHAATYTKTETKILQVKRGQKEKNAPEIVRKGRNRVRFGCWRRWERLRTGENGWGSQVTEPEYTPFPYNTCKKKTGGNPEFPPVLWQGQKDLVSAAASVGSRQSATGARSPLGTRFWSGCGRTQRGAKEGRCCPVFPAKSRKSGAGLVLSALLGEGLCIDYHFFLRKKSTSARRMAKLTRITAG